jgi:predicted DNA-binding transcriptional regulator AlpA
VAKTKQLSKNPTALNVSGEQRCRWARNGELAKYLGVSKMTIWRYKHEPSYDFPPAAKINNIEYLDKVDLWMEARVQR